MRGKKNRWGKGKEYKVLLKGRDDVAQPYEVVTPHTDYDPCPPGVHQLIFVLQDGCMVSEELAMGS